MLGREIVCDTPPPCFNLIRILFEKIREIAYVFNNLPLNYIIIHLSLLNLQVIDIFEWNNFFVCFFFTII